MVPYRAATIKKKQHRIRFSIIIYQLRIILPGIVPVLLSDSDRFLVFHVYNIGISKII